LNRNRLSLDMLLKDYIQLVNALYKAKPEYFEYTQEISKRSEILMYNQWCTCVVNIANALKESDQNFDLFRFIKDCGTGL